MAPVASLVKGSPRNRRCTPHGRSHPKLKAPQFSGAALLSCMNCSARAALGNNTEGESEGDASQKVDQAL